MACHFYFDEYASFSQFIQCQLDRAVMQEKTRIEVSMRKGILQKTLICVAD